MSDAGRAPDTANWNPVFAQRLQAFRDALTKAGIQTQIQSGYRSPEYQNQMYQNHLAKKAHQPLPFPNVEAPDVVAPPWRSFHNYGIAADVTPANPADYQRMWDMANQFGLTALRQQDMDHFQLAGTLDQNIKQYNLAGWRPDSRPAPDTGAIAYTGGPPSGQPPPNMVARGTGAPVGDMTHEQFIRDYAAKIGVDPDQAVAIARAEGLNAWSKSNPNAGSYVDRTGGVPWSFGDFQLNTRNGMGVDALKAGIDPKDPNQWQAADQFALDQMRAHGVGAWSNPVAKSIAAHGGLTLTSTPPASSIRPSWRTAARRRPAAPSFSDAAAKGDVGGMLHAALTKPPPKKDAQGNDVEQKSPLQKLASSVGDVAQKATPEVAPMQPAAPAVDPDPGLAPASQQLFSAVSASAARPLSWTSTPYGANAGLIRPGGTTLNATDYGNG